MIQQSLIAKNSYNQKIRHKSPYKYIGDKSLDYIFDYFNNINKNKEHLYSSDDICTQMECVKTMLDYIPEKMWRKKNLRILDPCAGNGNFGAYCKFKTNENNIWYNELNDVRFQNCKKILNPKNIRNGDFFNMNDSFSGKWDLIMANPPYSGSGNKNRSLSNSFIEHSIELLNNKGFLCFVTPNNWMTYNTNNTTLKKLLTEGSFLVIDNDVKKYFPGVGSSFTIFVWQKNVYDNKTFVVNNFLTKDSQKNIKIPNNLPFLPLYISQNIINLIPKVVTKERNSFNYRCDLHNFTQKELLNDEKNEVFKYKTIHTIRKTRYASKKQEIFNKWLIIIPLSTYYIPIIMHHVNTTQSVGYFSFDTKDEAEKYIKIITKPHFKLLIHLTRYGNFNNIMVLKYLNFDKKIKFNKKELKEIKELTERIKY